MLNRWVLSDVLNAVREEESLMDWGSEFQRMGAATEKALSPQDLRLVRVGRDRRLAVAERRERVGECLWRRSVR